MQLALRARDERAARPVMRVVKAPQKIRPSMRIRGWFRCHPNIYGPISIFAPKDEAGFDPEPVFVMPDIADELRAENTAFENAVREYDARLLFMRGGALILLLLPCPSLATGRPHKATVQKLDACAEAVDQWKRLDWNEALKEFDDMTGIEMEGEPEWPDDVSEVAILSRAFGERNVIQSVNDQMIRKFRGQN